MKTGKLFRRFILNLVGLAGVFSLHAQNQASAPAPATPALTNAPPPKPKAVWKGSAAVGATVTGGNSQTTLATATADVDRKTDANEWSAGADAAYGQSKTSGQTETTTTANLVHGFTQYNLLFTDRFYGYARVEARHDDVAAIRYRVSLGGGAGYYFIKNTNTDLSLEVGPGYVWQKQGADTSDFATLRVGEKFHQALSDRARLWESAEWLPQVDKFDNYYVNGELGIEADMSKDKKLSLRSYVTDSFNKEPAAGKKRNDVTWVTAIAYKF